VTLVPGQELLHYRIAEKIGEGGMGVVWKALDTALGRDVAIKVLPPGLDAEGERLLRFEREAKLLAALNHPNIAAVYGLHEQDGTRFIAMELVPGEDLSERLARGPLPVDEALAVARQVAEALEAAHEKGVIHRDLKPANVKVAPDGAVKVLDLGLAKALAGEVAADAAALSLSPTLTSGGTVAGTLLGTAAYMSPEQAKGKPVDRRADIWAFGCLLYEMLTGRKAFGGETVSEALASLLRDEVDWAALPLATPPAVARLLRRCLERDPRMRLRDAGEARIALGPDALARAEPVRSEGGPTPEGVARREWRIRAAVALAALAAGALGAMVLGRGGAAEVRREIRASILAPEGSRFVGFGVNAGGLSISPDGTRITFVAVDDAGKSMIWVRPLGSAAAQPLRGTEGGSFPFWSPDSRELGYFVDGKLMKADLAGGAPTTLADAPDSRGGTWNRTGDILFVPDIQAPVYRVSAAGGGTATPVTALDETRGETTHRYPSFLPDGRHFLFFRGSHGDVEGPANSIWVGSLDGAEPVELMPATRNAVYAQGHVFWVRDHYLMARPFDPESLRFTGELFSVAESVVGQPTYWRAAFDVSPAGPIVYLSGGLAEQRLAVFDRAGKVLASPAVGAQYHFIRLSPDDRKLAAAVQPASGGSDLWLFDLERETGGRLTFESGREDFPVWSPDGSRIAYRADLEDGSSGIYVRSADGRGDPVLVFEGAGHPTPEDWSPDGRYLAMNLGDTRKDLWIVPLDGSEPFVVVGTDADEGYARFSRDGEWLFYLSNETRRYEVYLTRFPSGDGKWLLSDDGASWLIGVNHDATEAYYLSYEGAVVAVELELADLVVVGEPTVLFRARAEESFTVSSDGQRFVLGVPDDAFDTFPLQLVLNWAGRR